MCDPLVKWPTLFAHLNPALIRAGTAPPHVYTRRLPFGFVTVRRETESYLTGLPHLPMPPPAAPYSAAHLARGSGSPILQQPGHSRQV